MANVLRTQCTAMIFGIGMASLDESAPITMQGTWISVSGKKTSDPYEDNSERLDLQ